MAEFDPDAYLGAGTATAEPEGFDPDQYLNRPGLGGALSGKEAAFTEAGQRHGVDPNLLMAISMFETGNGTSHAARAYNNVGGMMSPSDPMRLQKFESVEQGADAMASNLRRNYIDKGLTTIDAIAAKYSPVGAANDPNRTNNEWPSAVMRNYAKLGGEIQPVYIEKAQPVQAQEIEVRRGQPVNAELPAEAGRNAELKTEAFDPDKYLASAEQVSQEQVVAEFDPDKYLAATTPVDPEKFMPTSTLTPGEEKAAVVQAASEHPLLENAAGAAVDLAKGVPGMIAALPGYAYQGAKFAAGGPQERKEVIREAGKEALQMGTAVRQDLEAPAGSREWFRGIGQAIMLGAPGLELLREFRIRPPERPPIEKPPMQFEGTPEMARVDPAAVAAERQAGSTAGPTGETPVPQPAPETSVPATDVPPPPQTLKTFADIPPDFVPVVEPAGPQPPEAPGPKPSAEEFARRQYEKELQQEYKQHVQAEGGIDLIEAIKLEGGFPVMGTPGHEAFKGELKMLREAIRGTRGAGKVSDYFNKTAKGADDLLNKLRARGFNIDTPGELIDVTIGRVASGKPYIAYPETGVALYGDMPFAPKKRPAIPQYELPGAEEQFNLAGETGIDWAARQAETEAAAVRAAEAKAIQDRQQQEFFSPAVRAPAAPPIQPPVAPLGQIMTMGGDLPVTMARTQPGTVAAPAVMDSLKRVMVTAGSAGEIRRGRFGGMGRFAKGVFKSKPEVIRLEHIDDVPTAVHEVGHALMKQFYGTVKASGLKGIPGAVRRELVGLGLELYGARKPVAGYSGEGFSEFVRLYLTTDSQGRTAAPNAFRFFEENVLKDHPEVAAELQKAKGLIDTYRFQGAQARANSQLVREPGWTRRTLKALRDVFSFQKFAESGEPLRQLSKEAKQRLGKPLPASADPYKLFKMKRGASGPILERMVDVNMVDLWGNPTGPSLKEAFAEVKNKRGEFLLYTFGRVAERRWAEGKNPGITKEDAAFLRQTLESPEFDRAAMKYQDWLHGLLDYVAQADPSMAPLAAKLKDSGFYAPLARMLDENAVRRETMKAQSNPFYRMHGSGLPVKDIFDQTLVNASRLISRAHRQVITNAVVKLARIDGLGKYIERVPQDRVQKLLNVEQIRGDLEKMGIDTSSLPENELLKYYTPADQPKGADPIVTVKQPDGSAEWYYVDTKLYDVLNTLEPFSLRSIPHLGVALDLVVGAPKRLFTMGTTGLRPTFSLLTNPLRDPQGWFMQTKASVNPAKMAAAYFGAVGDQLRAAATGREGPFMEAALNLGPQMSQALGRDIQYTKQASTGLFHGRLMRVVKTPIDHLRQLLNIPESFPRMAEFRRVAEEVGWKPGETITPDQAVEMSIAFKEATVDFSAHGEVSRIVNEGVPFFNPNIQGLRTAARAFRDHPVRTTLAGLSAFTGPALALWWLNKDKEWYKNLPWRERYYYNNIDDGKNVWQIPRAFEWGNLFQVLPEAALDSWYRSDPESVKQAVGHIFKTQNPFDYPVALRIAKEQWQNKIEFWDRPIVPRSEVDLAPGAQVGPYTSKVATWLGKAFPNQVSPRRVDAAVRGLAGGAVPDLLDGIGLGAQKKTRESELADTPVIGKLWRRGGFYNAQSQHIADFYDIKQGVDARVAAVRLQMNDPNRAQTIAENPRDTLMATIFDASGDNISQALRLANQLRESRGRQMLYKLAADEAKMAVEMWNQSGKLEGSLNAY